MKKVFAMILMLAMVLSAVSITAAQDITLVLNDEQFTMEKDALELDGTVWMPLRAYAENMGATVSWDDEAQCAIVEHGGVEFTFPIGETWYKKSGLKYTLTKAARLVDETTYFPLDALVAFGSVYEWDEDAKSVKITSSILDGRYVVVTNTATGKVLSLEGEESENKGKISVQTRADGDNQIWLFEAKGANIYAMVNKQVDKAIDISGGNKDPGVILSVYGRNGGDNQSLVPVKCEGGYYLKCYHSDLYATVNDNGLVSQEALTGEENQIFTLEVVGERENAAIVKVEDSELDPMGNKFFTVKADGFEGVYQFVLQGTGKYLPVNKDTKLSITGEPVDFSAEQIFTLEDAGDGAFYLKSEAGSYLMDQAAFSITAPEVLVPSYGEDSMGGKYYEVTHIPTGKLLMVENESADNNGVILVGESENADSVQWGFIAQGVDMYTLLNKKSNRAIDIPGASKDEGKGAIQYDANHNDNQVFVVEANADGSFYLKNKNSDLYLALKDGAMVQTAQKTDTFSAKYMGECDLGARMAATATPFVLKGKDSVTNVKLQWNEVKGASEYDIFRSVDGGDYVFHTSLAGITVDDYDLEVGKTYQYRVYALNSGDLVESAETEAFTPYEMPADMKSSTNLEPSGFSTPGGGMTDKDGLYYRFNQRSRTDGGKGFGMMVMSTSTDGVNFTEPVEVLNIDEMLAHETCKDLEDLRFESVNIKYNPKANNFGFIAHAEPGSGGYGFASISIATYTPGDERMVFHGAVRPEGDDVRDLNTFIDEDGTTYIMGATHNNADLAIYRLKDDWSGIDKRVALINNGKWRELPNILKVDGIYYLFSSGCAGWYPTPGMYNSATSMDGPWSELRSAGNTSTFSSQSGYVFSLKKGSRNFIMNSYRWMGNWQDAIVRTTQSLRSPVKVKDGFAFYDYFEELLYNWDEDCLVPVQRGRIVSQNMPNVTDGAWALTSNANDGIYSTIWTPENKWPYTWEVDLGQAYNLTQAQISWRIQNGGEAYYQYKIEGSNDGKTYFMLCDRTSGYTDYGFTVDNMHGNARYVRITVEKAVSRSDHEYAANMFEMKLIAQ